MFFLFSCEPQMNVSAMLHDLGVNQKISFMEFMHQALYAPGVGYYSSGLEKFGRKGDFITAPELTPLFGYTLANQCHQLLSAVDNPNIFEFGAGSGTLCVDILTKLQQLHCLPQSYFILEISPYLKQRQKDLIKERIPHLYDKVVWVEKWLEQPFNGVIIANEVLDAMPVHRILRTQTGFLESFVILNDTGKLQEIFEPCDNLRLLDHIDKYVPSLNPPYLFEVNLFLKDWVAGNYAMLDQGALLLIDYGFPQHEYYHADRHQGTLMCHHQHHAHTNPLLHPGEQDITAHVDFTYLAHAAQDAGFHVAGYTNQASFLLANGLLSLHDETGKTSFEMNQAIKQLTYPSEMGELFKVMALTKNIDLDLNGFLLHDKRASL